MQTAILSLYAHFLNPTNTARVFYGKGSAIFISLFGIVRGLNTR